MFKDDNEKSCVGEKFCLFVSLFVLNIKMSQRTSNIATLLKETHILVNMSTTGKD